MSVKSTITRRFAVMYLFMMLIGVLIVVQMVRIVMLEKKDGEGTGGVIIIRTVKIPADRGRILAHDGRILATTVYKYRLFNDFKADGLTDTAFNNNVDELAKGLSRIFKDKSAQEYAKELRNDRYEAVHKGRHRNRPLIRRDVDYTELQELKKLPILRNGRNSGGLIIRPQTRRIHPYESMARNTVGRTNNAAIGTSGIEQYYNNELTGKPGEDILHQTTGQNVWIPISSTPQVEPVDGCDIITTIDVDMQEMAEGVIKEALAKNPDLEWGTAVIMEVNTGEVRAIANKKIKRDKQTNDIVDIFEDDNYALRYRKDPGSTFKLASFMVMLEKGLRLTDTVNTDNGKIKLYNKTFEDEGSKGGLMSVQQAFEKSSNVGTVHFAQRIYKRDENKKDFAERIEALKLKEIVNYDILGNYRGVSPLIKSASEFSGLTLSMMSMGYELELTPLQTLSLYNAVANNGEMVHPKFMKELRQQGKVVRTFPEKQVVHAKICSQKTLDTLQKMLLAVVNKGTATRARSNSFLIAGKTGTAHIAEDKGGYTNQKLSSFAGYFPADNPKYSCIVIFKTFDTYNKSYGGAIAAPVFKQIAEKVYARSTTWRKAIDEKAAIDEAPYTKSGSYDKLLFVLNTLEIPSKADNISNEWVSTDMQDSVIHIRHRSMVKNFVPNVQNMALQDAIFILENAGLRVRFSGKGTIKSQNPLPGSSYTTGDVVALALTHSD